MTDSFSDLLAREELIQHARSQRYRGAQKNADARQEEYNPMCGDRVTVYIKTAVAAGTSDIPVVERMSFEADGCIISQAAASLLAEHAQGKHVNDIAALDHSDMEQLIGGPLSPARVKCSMLPLVALKAALGIG